MGRFETEILTRLVQRRVQEIQVAGSPAYPFNGRPRRIAEQAVGAATHAPAPSECVGALGNVRSAEGWEYAIRTEVNSHFAWLVKRGQGRRLPLQADISNFVNFVRILTLPKRSRTGSSRRSLHERLIKAGSQIVRHGRYALFQMAKAVVPYTTVQSITSSAPMTAGSGRTQWYH